MRTHELDTGTEEAARRSRVSCLRAADCPNWANGIVFGRWCPRGVGSGEGKGASGILRAVTQAGSQTASQPQRGGEITSRGPKKTGGNINVVIPRLITALLAMGLTQSSPPCQFPSLTFR